MIIGSSISKEAGDFADLSPDLTAMLDILFILLFFFMLTIGSVYQSLDLSLPKKTDSRKNFQQSDKDAILEIGLHSYALNGKELRSFLELKKALALLFAEESQSKIVIAGEKSITMERLLEVLSYLQEQKIRTANILMQRDSQQKR